MSVFIPTPKKGNAKESSNYHTFAFISHANKVKVSQSCPTLCNPIYRSWNFPGQNTGVGSLSLLQGIFPICYQGYAQNPSSQASAVHELSISRQMFKLDFKKTQELKIKLSTSVESQRKQGNFRKKHLFCFIDYAKTLDLVHHNKLENSEKYGNTRPSYLSPEKPLCRSRSNSQNQTWNNRLVPNQERSTSRLYIVFLLI